MRVISERQLAIVLGALAGTPRVVAGGGPGMRGQGRLRYFPCRLSLVPALLATAMPPDVVIVQTSVPSSGTVSLGTEVNILPAAIEAARSRGGLAPPERPRAESSVVIGDRVAALIGDGATLQAGIGAVPDAVLAGLHRRRGLSVWSEMFSDGVLGLAKAGALDPGKPVTGSFAFGSADLYASMDRNPDVHMRSSRSRPGIQHSFIVSEQGAAAVWGYDAAGQAEQVIDHVAHPSAREQLREAGRSLGLHRSLVAGPVT